MSDETLISDEEYVQREGLLCPVCRSKNVSSDSYDQGSNAAIVVADVQCIDCDAEWTDIFRLTSYEMVDPLPDLNPPQRGEADNLTTEPGGAPSDSVA